MRLQRIKANISAPVLEVKQEVQEVVRDIANHAKFLGWAAMTPVMDEAGFISVSPDDKSSPSVIKPAGAAAAIGTVQGVPYLTSALKSSPSVAFGQTTAPNLAVQTSVSQNDAYQAPVSVNPNTLSTPVPTNGGLPIAESLESSSTEPSSTASNVISSQFTESQPPKRGLLHFNKTLAKIAGVALLITLLVGGWGLYIGNRDRTGQPTTVSQTIPEQTLNLTVTQLNQLMGDVNFDQQQELLVQGDGTFTGNLTAANLFGNGNGLTNLNATNITAGTLSDNQLSDNVTVQGNTFNGLGELVQLTAEGILPVLDGSNLFNLSVTADIEGVIAGSGLTGGGTTREVTLDLVSGNGGIVVSSNDISLNLQISADGLSATTSSGSGLEILAGGLTLLQGCGDGQVLQWIEGSDIWSCANGVAASNAFVQNGNSFGATAVLGTNDSNNLAFETNNVTRAYFDTSGDFLPNVDDTYALGSNSLRWEDLFLGPATLHIGTSTSDEGTLSYNTTTNSFIFGNPTASQNAFQFQNASSANIANINTSTSVQLIQNNSIEANTNGWIAKGASTIAISDAVAAQYGTRFLSTTTTTAANDGAAYRVPLKASTQYSLSLWLRRSTSTTSDINIGYQEYGSDINCLTGQTVNTTWTQYTCTFTTGASVNLSTNIFVKQTGTTAQTIYLDGASLVQAASSLTFDAGGNNFNVQSLNSGITLNNTNTGEIQPWQLNANALPGLRAWHSSVVANGYVYVIGAYVSGTHATVYYAKLNADGSTGAWQTSANALPSGRSNHTSVVANGYVYVIGGWNGSYQSTVYYAKLNADGSTGVWSTSANALPLVRGDHTSVVANGYVYVIGGWPDDINSQSTVYYAKLNADGSTGAWQTSANALPSPRSNHTSVVANGYVYVIGGSNGGFVDTVFYAKLNADGSTGVWSTSANALTLERGDHTSVVANGYVYVIGGQPGSTNQSSVTVYYAKLNADGSTGAWQTSANALPSPRGYHTSVIANGYVYVIGGWDGGWYSFTVYYTSTSRILAGGSLDLVGLGGQVLGDVGGTGGSLVAADGTFVGNLQVQGNAAFASSVSIDKGLTVNDTGYFKSSTPNSDSAADTGFDGLEVNFTQSDDNDATDINAALKLTVTSSSGDADTLYGLNIANITGGSAAETAINVGTGWDKAINTTQSAATQALTIDASTTANTTTAGVIDLNVNSLTANNVGLNIDYTVNDTAASGADTFAAKINLTQNDADSDAFGLKLTATDTANAIAGSYEALIWLDNADTTASSLNDAILITSSGVNNGVIDAIDASDTSITNALNAGANNLVGTNWNLTGSSGQLDLGAASSVTGALVFLNSSNSNTLKLQAGATGSGLTFTLPTAAPGANNYCLVSSTVGTLSFLPCGAGATATETLVPEFPGAVLTGDGTNNTGTMTSDFCSGSSRQNVNTSVCTVTTESHNYYSWTANATNDYDAWIRWQVPSDFSTFSSASFNGWRTSSSDSVTATIYNNSASSCDSASISGTVATWNSTSFSSIGSCTPTAGDVLNIRVQLSVGVNGEFGRIGEFTFTYNRK